MQNGNRIVGRTVLEHNHKATVAKSLRTFLVRDFAIVNQLDAVGLCEMLAFLRK